MYVLVVTFIIRFGFYLISEIGLALVKLLGAINRYCICGMQDLELGKSLVRPSGLFSEDLSKESLLTKENYGSVDRVFIICEEDEVVKEDFQLQMIQNHQPKEVKKISRAGHMVMLSRPAEFCQTLQDIAVNFES